MSSTPHPVPDPETIVAISTPPGRGGIGIVRLSGKDAMRVANTMVRLRRPVEHARARFGEVVDPTDGGKLDDVIVTYFASPRSYTGEDVVEIAAHGSPVLLEALIAHALETGARLAAPGEFTERAFLSGRIDLTQAEAVRDLIEARTLYQARVAAQQMGGALSRRIAPAKQQLFGLIAQLEAGIDFAEDDIDVMPAGEILTHIDSIDRALRETAASFARGRIIHSGLSLAIVGRTNVGKSSLFNRIVERERAIVTAMPGTTRDLVTETISIGGIPVELVDTAGLRELGSTPQEEAERIGISRTREALADADLVLIVLDSAAGCSQEEEDLLQSLAGRRAIVVANKTDLPHPPSPAQIHGVEVIPTSALTGEGVDRLKARIAAMCGTGQEAEGGILTNLRQSQEVDGAIESLSSARHATETAIPHEMLLLDLYAALHHLDSLTGATTPDDILNHIFSTFCIGK